MKAECQCGQLSVALPPAMPAVVACHCIACQRRTGAPFGVLAYYASNQVKPVGKERSFVRPTDDGQNVESFFCPDCGSTVYLKASKYSALVGISIGAIADPAFHAPQLSLWEQSRHEWVEMSAEIGRFAQDEGASLG